MGETKMHTKFQLENPNRKDCSEDPGKIMLKWILGKKGGKVWTGCSWLRTGTTGSFP